MALLTCEKRSADITDSIESRDGGITLKEFSTWLLAPENAEVLNEMTALVRSFGNDYSKLSCNALVLINIVIWL